MREYRILPTRTVSSLKTAALALTVALWMTVTMTPSLAQSRLELDCLALAASPLQPDLPAGVTGLPFGEFDAEAALPICEAAMAEPGVMLSPRLAFPMGRVYLKLGRYEEAIAVYMKYEDDGYGPILSNLGVINEEGTGQPVNLDLAFDYYRRAGQAGLSNGWSNALALLDRSDAPASVKPNLAEVLREVVATSGDANAAYRLAEAIASGQIAPASPDERKRMLETSLDGGKLDGAVTLIRLQEESDGHVAAFLTAERALNMAQSASLDQDAGWPAYQPSIALEIVRLGTEHSDYAPLQKAAAGLDAQYGDKIYTLSISGTTCAGTATPLSFFYWDEAGRDTSPIDSQIAYYKLRECDAPSESIKEINDIFVKSKADGTSFVAMLNAFVESTQEAPDNPEAAPAQRKLSEVYAVFEKGSDGTYWVNPAPGQAATGEGVVKLSAGLTCEDKKVSGEFSVFRNPAQRAMPDFQARVVATLLAGTSCDLETNAGLEIDSIAGPLRGSEDFSDDVYVSILFDQSVNERWQSGRVPLIHSLSTACTQTIVEGMEEFAHYERASDSEIGSRLTRWTADAAFIDEKSLDLDPSSVLVSADDMLSISVHLWNYGHLLATCASQTYFLDKTMLLDRTLFREPGFSEGNVLALAVDVATEEVEVAGARYVMEDEGLQRDSGSLEFGDWELVYGSGYYLASTSTKVGGRYKAFGYRCNAVNRVASAVTFFSDDEEPVPTAIDISGIGQVELEVYTDPDFGESVRFRGLSAKTAVDLFELIRNATVDIVLEYDDGTSAVFSARGSTAALDAARKRCNATIKAFRSPPQ